MSDKTVIVVGVGALGSHVVQLLRNEDVTIKVIDFDRVETKNVASQFHSRPGVGKNKTEALRQTMDFLFGRKITALPRKFEFANATQLIPRTTNLVVDCLDNGHSRRVLQEHCRYLNVPLLHGALAAGGEFGRVVWDEHFVVDDEAGAGAPTCEGGEHLPFVALTSSLLATAAQKFLTTGKKIGFSVSPTTVTPI